VHAFQILPQDIGRSLEAFAHTILHESLLEDVQRVARNGELFEKDVQDRQGSWYLLRILPYRSKGRIDGVVITLIDISTIKRTEAELRRMSKVFMDGADPIVIEDLNGRIIDLNNEAATAYGWTREELIGQPCTILVPPELAAEAEQLRERCRNLEHVRNFEFERRDRSGNVYPILLTLSTLVDEHGAPIGVALISKDIQQQKEAERQAREAVVRRDEFLAMLSHELRNPLGAVINAAERLARDTGLASSSAYASDVVLRQSRQMARLLDDLLDVSRITQGKIDVRMEAVDLRTLAQDAAEAVRPDIDKRHHTLELKLPDEPLFVEGDPSRLLQIQENLLGNAAKYTAPGGRIVLVMRKEGDQAVFAVEDNGQGIPPDMLSAIFELFVQGPKSLARTEGGMGIGLSLVRMLVELHGGSVSVHSGGKSQGSTFTVRLPLTEKRPAVSPKCDVRQPTDLRVLIVEDNDDGRELLGKLLQLEGYHVSLASNGTAGFEAVCRDCPDVVLLDIGLPGMDGYEVARKIRAELDGRPIRLVALTGYGRAEDHAAIVAAGFDDHLVKPIDPPELKRALRKAK
jgi:two-component system CheB/CheR fusion protein